MSGNQVDLSVIIVSYNNRNLLRDCLDAVESSVGEYTYETIIVDNGSTDDTSQWLRKEYPKVNLVTEEKNLGFAGANNVGFSHAKGRYWVILNTDAIVQDNALAKAIALMDTNPSVGLGGARLLGRDGADQPSALLFPSILNNILFLTGLANKYSQNRFFGRAQRSWADPQVPASVDWVPGAFSIIRQELVKEMDFFDPRFFFYYEEVDLCRRIKQAGYTIKYWPQIRVVHFGGEPKQAGDNRVEETLLLWRMHSELLYYRKHHGRLGAYSSFLLEYGWHFLRSLRHKGFKREQAKKIMKTKKQAWKDTCGGKRAVLGQGKHQRKSV